MGNAFIFSCSPCQDQNKISTDILQTIVGMQQADELLAYIDELIEKIDKGEQGQVNKSSLVASCIKCGGDLMEKLSKRLNRHVSKKCLLSTLDRQTRKVVVDVLNQAQHIQCVGIALSITAHLLERAEQVSANKDQCLRLLRHMSALAKHMKDLDIHLGRAKLDKILSFIVKGALICALQMKANILCRFISAPLNNDDLRNLESDLVHSYGDLELEALTAVLYTQSVLVANTENVLSTQNVLVANTENISNRLPNVPGPSQGEYPSDAVALEEAQNEVTKLLALAESSRRVVVIYGVGGIGKTTLATAVFKSLDLTGYHYCRVDMDQDCKLSDLQAMQEQILRELFEENLKLSNCTHGREKLGEAFGKASKPVFLFIDNALRQTDLEKLLPINHISGLPMRSRILVTTRNLKETNICRLQHGVQFCPHRIDSISEPKAKRILCHYAVGDMNGNFDGGVDMYGLLQICGGIPLVLRIVGSHLRTKLLDGEGNVLSAYSDTLQYFKEWQQEGFEGGEEDVSESIVGFVYRRLKEPCKQSFLDIAFFFYGWERSKVAYIVGEDHLHDLEVAALVTTSEEVRWKMEKRVSKTVVKMHDIVRARGKKLSDGTRINDIESLPVLLSDAQKLQQIKGVWLRDDDDDELQAKHVDLMSNSLRVLSLGKRMRVNGRCERVFEQLRFLHISSGHMLLLHPCKASRLIFFRVDFSKGSHTMPELPESLRVLHLCGDEDYPVSLDIIGHFIPVRQLKLSHITLHSFGNMPCLQALDMSDCSELQGLPESFGNMSCLQTLDMSWCSQLQGLPESFGNMSCLQTLAMRNCSQLQGLPESFGNMSCLQTLDMSWCWQLQGLPESFGNMSCLQTLNMSNCRELQGLPQTFDQLSCLQTLKIDGCERMCSFSVNFGKFKGLKFLNISNCKELNRLPEDIVCLKSLAAIKANRCASLEAKAMDSLVDITSLTFLDIDDSPMLIKRWEEIIQQHPPPIGLPLRLTRHSVGFPYKPDEGTVSAMFFRGGSTFLDVDGESMSSFPDAGVKVCLLTAGDILSQEMKQKVAEVASQEFQIMYVDVGMEGEAKEEREKRIREVLVQLPEGSRVWASPFYKTRLLFAYSLWGVNTSIWGTSVLVDGEGRRKLSQPFETIFEGDWSVKLTDLFSPLSKAWDWMQNEHFGEA